MNILYILIFIWNLLVFLMYGADKYYAKKEKWRIKESTLILSAFLMGGIGALLGIFAFRHKTRKLKFRIFVPIATILNVLFIIWLNTLNLK